MALSCYLFCWSVQTALFVLLAAATGTRLVAANLEEGHHRLRSCWALTSLRQEVGMQCRIRAAKRALLVSSCRFSLLSSSSDSAIIASATVSGQAVLTMEPVKYLLDLTTTPSVDQRSPLAVQFKLHGSFFVQPVTGTCFCVW